MYEETKSSIDWKGIILKVIIAFLVIVIAAKGYTMLKDDNNKKVENTTNATAESKSSTTFTANMEKLREVGEKYFKENTKKLPKDGNTTMVTLKELINEGAIENLSDENGKTCDGESSYVTATTEGNKTKIKANLVCGEASSHSLVYMDANASQTEEKKETVNSSNKTSSTSNKTSSTTKTETIVKEENKTTCVDSCKTPVVNVNATADANVVINKKPTTTTKAPTTTTTTTTKKVEKYYTVKFDSNGGTKQYADEVVKEGYTATYPGITERTGYTFLGWYLDGERYDFATKVTKDITLEAKYSRNRYVVETEDEDEDYKYSSSTNNDYVAGRKKQTTTVYSMAWAAYGTDNITVKHTLRLPKTIANDDDVYKVRISEVEFLRGITKESEIKTFKNNHYNTFLYSNNGWEAKRILEENLAEISKLPKYTNITTSNRYKDIDEAIEEGFDVEWNATKVLSQCEDTFSVNGVDGLCNYGIVYRVTWEYK